MRSMVFVKMAEDVGDAPAELQEVMGREMTETFAAGSMIDPAGSTSPRRAWSSGWPAGSC